MGCHPFVRAFASSSAEYHESFKVFLDHTDQKEKAFAWLDREVEGLPRREIMIDAGAGNGTLTARFAKEFDRLIAVEPNQSLIPDLRLRCPAAEIVPAQICEAEPPAADFVLCSHVFYYIPPSDWEQNAARIAGWIRPGGVLAIGLQNPNTDCMKMVDHFIGRRCDLRDLQGLADFADGERFQVRIDTIKAMILAPDLGVACAVAEFILNVLPMPQPPRWEELERYVESNFRQADGRYAFSCDQDFLHVGRLAGVRELLPAGISG